MRALSSQVVFRVFFSKSLLGFQFWTFIFVHFSKPNSLFGKNVESNIYYFITYLKRNKPLVKIMFLVDSLGWRIQR